RRPSKSSGLTSLNVLSTVAFTLPLSPSICAPASRPTIVTSCPALRSASYGSLNSESSNFGPRTVAIFIGHLQKLIVKNHLTEPGGAFVEPGPWVKPNLHATPIFRIAMAGRSRRRGAGDLSREHARHRRGAVRDRRRAQASS